MTKRRHLINPGQAYIVGGGGSVSGGTASPLPYNDLVYLFDARSGVTTGSSLEVTSWAPVVGGDAMAQATASHQPALVTFNGHPAIDFDGNDELAGSATKLGFAPPTGATITNITSANPGVVTTSAPHGFSNGDTVVLSTLASTMAALNGFSFEVTVVSSTEFSLGMDLTSLTYASGGTATLGGPQTLIAVWASDAAAPSFSMRGIAGWSASSSYGRFWHQGNGLGHGYNKAYFTINGSLSPFGYSIYNFSNSVSETDVQVAVSHTFSFTQYNRTMEMVTAEAGSSPSSATLLSTGTVGTPAARTSATMSCGSYVDLSNTQRCLDGKIHAIYYWNRILSGDELTRTVERIGGLWRG